MANKVDLSMIPDFIRENQGSNIKSIIEIMGGSETHVRKELQKLYNDGILFKQHRGSVVYYYSADYAKKNYLEERVITIKQGGDWHKKKKAEREKKALTERTPREDMLRLYSLMPINRSAVK